MALFNRESPATCWINGDLVNPQQAVISVFDHGLLYGDGVFEGIRFYRKHCFRLGQHLQRLEASARAIALTLPYSQRHLAAAIDDVIARSPLTDGYIRLIVTRGVGPLGLDPSRCSQPTVIIIADRLILVGDEVRARGARVITAVARRLAADGLDPRIKSLNYLNPVLARMEANRAGADEALLLNSAGRVAEGSADNVFIVSNGELLTPPIWEGALAGVTRQAVLSLADELGIPARETPLTSYDLYTADECFLSGTGAELIPVAEVDGRPITKCPGPVFTGLLAAYRQLIDRETNHDN